MPRGWNCTPTDGECCSAADCRDECSDHATARSAADLSTGRFTAGRLAAASAGIFDAATQEVVKGLDLGIAYTWAYSPSSGGGAAGLFYIGYQEQQNQLANSNSSTPTWASPTPRKNSTTTPTTTSPSSRTNVDSLDLSLWVRPASVYGSTKFEGGELIVSSKDADHYYVITGAEDLKSTNADVSITVRNVNSKAARTGYGLIFHSDPDRALRQDYVLLIDSMKQRYRIARHDSSQELDVTDWTKNTAINSGSAENKLEIRDHPDTGKVDLYINGQLVDSIKNEFGYPGGVVGIYAGDAIPVAFKDFEIRTN